jgi:hypothetical protein
MNEHEARALWLKFEYTRLIGSANVDLSPEEIEITDEYGEEYEFITGGETIDLMGTDELTDWYAGTGNAVHAILGDYVRF